MAEKKQQIQILTNLEELSFRTVLAFPKAKNKTKTRRTCEAKCGYESLFEGQTTDSF